MSSNYTLETGKRGEQRLDFLHTLCGPSTLEFYKRAGLKTGMRVLDVGCGTGNTTIEIAKLIGFSGEVIAIDISKKQIDLAKANAAHNEIKNITFITQSADDLRDLGQFDFICSRFLLVHLHNPNAALQAMYDKLKIGGVLACEEPQWSDYFSEPYSEAIEQLIKWQLQYAEKIEVDFEIGIKLLELLSAFSLKDITTTTYRPIVKGASPIKSIWAMFATEAKDKYVKYNIASKTEVDSLIDSLKKYADNPATSFGLARQYQIYAIKS